jgi:sugar phosphate isomerase/epimerase
MLGHIRRVTAIAATLGAEVLVFGAPKQRTKGDLTEEAAFLLGVRRLGILAQACADKGVTLGLEPVPAAYGGDFLPTWQDVQRMVDAVASSHIAVHLDTACIKLGGGDIGEAIASTQSSLKHFHIAEPQLGNFANPLEEHTIAAAALHKAGYNGWLAIEMLGKTDAAWGDTLESIAFSRRCYGDN